MSYDLDDIEDLGIQDSVAALGAADEPRQSAKVIIPSRRSQRRHEPSQTKAPDHMPEACNVWVKTWGCSHNNSDGEYMVGQLAAYGYNIVDASEAADVWVLNGCTVKNPSQDTFTNEVRKGRDAGKHVVLAGCVSQGQPNHKEFKQHSVIGVQQIDRVVEVVEETVKGHTVRLLGQKKDGGARLHLPKVRKNPLIEIIPINTGCLNQCTYCKTKHARGDLRSYLPEEIEARVKAVVSEGVVEIWLTSEDLGTYGRDIGTDLPSLLWRIVPLLPEGVMLRCGMTNPPYILEHLEEMAKILKHPRVYSFLHVPVQAGADSVLHAMRREYTNAEFCRVVDYLLEHVPDMTIATDVICGFPTETAEDFEETLQLVKKYRFPVLHISQFYPRHGTPAARMPRVPSQEAKRRSRELTTLFESYRTRDHKFGSTARVLVAEVARDGLHYVAHDKSYNQVLVPMEPNIMGRMVEVKIVEVGKHFLRGELVSCAAVGEESKSKADEMPAVSTHQLDHMSPTEANAFATEITVQRRKEVRRRKRQEKQQQRDASISGDQPSAVPAKHDRGPEVQANKRARALSIGVGLLLLAMAVVAWLSTDHVLWASSAARQQ